MRPIILLLLSFLGTVSFSQDSTYVISYDPNPQNPYIADKGANIWNIGNYVYIVDSYVDDAFLRNQHILKINLNTKEIEKKITLEKPQGDLAVSQIGGHLLTKDKKVVLTGEWYDYDREKMCSFLAKLDEDLNIIWINYYPDLAILNIYGDGVAETTDGNYLWYATETIQSSPQPKEDVIRIIKTDTSGAILLSSIVQDTFNTSYGFGDITPTDDGNFLLSSAVVDFDGHPEKAYNNLLFKIDAEGNTIWGRTLDRFVQVLITGAHSTALAGGGGAVVAAKDTLSANPAVIPTFPVLYGYDGLGNQTWAHEWHDVAIREIYRIIKANNGDILGLGYYSKGSNPGKGWLFRASPQGEILWERYYSDSLQRPWSPLFELLDFCELEDGRIAAVGIVVDTSIVGLPNANIGLLIVDANGCLYPDCTGANHYFTETFEPMAIFPRRYSIICEPNPSAGSFHVRLPSLDTRHEPAELRVSDMSGNLLKRIEWTSDATALQVENIGLPPGFYAITAYAQNRPFATGKHIIKQP
jgi:hypothetical protein